MRLASLEARGGLFQTEYFQSEGPNTLVSVIAGRLHVDVRIIIIIIIRE
jgi:hypothetical protein